MSAEEKPASQSNGVSSPSPSRAAVFLSYASQDAVAAARIATALRGAGIEVWFDQSELRGGDVWDQRIRREIRDCALFMPVISHHTQERLEGCFRLEWKLAVDRSHLMAIERPFLVPVVTDSTPDQEALVPDAFRAVQWTRLPAAEMPATFVRRVQHLLSLEASALIRAPAACSRQAAEMGRTAVAITAGHRAIALDPLNFHVHRMVGIAFLLSRQYADALAAFRAAVSLQPDYVRDVHLRGEAQYAMGDYDAARKSCEVAPADEISNACLARTYRKLGRNADAETVCKDCDRLRAIPAPTTTRRSTHSGAM